MALLPNLLSSKSIKSDDVKNAHITLKLRRRQKITPDNIYRLSLFCSIIRFRRTTDFGKFFECEEDGK